MDGRATTEKQKAHMEGVLRDPETRRKAHSWLREDTTDHWRHARIRREILPLLERPSRWVTFGDGRFGTDAHFLLQHGQRVVATDLSESMLREGKERGFITDYVTCNAENLPFEDGSFDWGYCKEAYHHCPRAPRALLEMLRVVRHGLVLQEPAELEGRTLLGALAVAARARLRPAAGLAFEPSGNFVYSVSRREIAKMLLGVGLTVFYTRYIQDAYLEGVEFEEYPGPLARRIRRRISLVRALSWLTGIEGVGSLMTIVIPKVEDGALHERLVRAGFAVTRLPSNPYA